MNSLSETQMEALCDLYSEGNPPSKEERDALCTECSVNRMVYSQMFRPTVGSVLKSKSFKPERKIWMGSTPEKCDICHGEFQDDEFIDGATVYGPWAMMCPKCHRKVGRGLGTGFGQKYRFDLHHKEWVKVRG